MKLKTDVGDSRDRELALTDSSLPQAIPGAASAATAAVLKQKTGVVFRIGVAAAQLETTAGNAAALGAGMELEAVPVVGAGAVAALKLKTGVGMVASALSRGTGGEGGEGTSGDTATCRCRSMPSPKPGLCEIETGQRAVPAVRPAMPRRLCVYASEAV